MSDLTFEQIRDFQSMEVVPVEAFGGTVYVRAWTGEELGSFQDWMEKSKAVGQTYKWMHAQVVARSLSDANGRPLCGVDDLAVIAKKPAKELDKVFQVAVVLNGLSTKAVEDAEKNYATDQTA